ncbi:MAG: SDR family oxidoreductase [Alphaproteobacteria bacterium]
MNVFTDVTALVTGANRGIGRAFVETLLEAGAKKVYATARSPEKLNDLVANSGGRVVALPLDVTDQDQVAALPEAVGDVSVLINNAGVAAYAGLLKADGIDGARLEMETNYFGTLNMVRALAPVLARNGGGLIVNIASIASLVSFPVLGSYSASKAAVHSLTQAIRSDLADQKTKVFGVYPGPVDTDMAAGVEMDKIAPADLVRNVFHDIEDGVEDIYPDPTAQELWSGLRADPKAVEKQIGQMLPA